MGASSGTIFLFTLLWVAIGAGTPWFVPNKSWRPLAQMVIVMSSVCCYVFWLCTYIAQMNPLIGPLLERNTLIAASAAWIG
ncbi:V-type proton ATPase subunit e 2-like [Tropilaelaps mercedesae]|uniref:V-type proton ATPase subunit e 2-like n=1 Tax=Tropilaelaps mercedesae TaxID=418985 RepID=A0A1V9Y1Z3_9ACAR|nr:V-type proton ATPase subunit e 2-like [Tropilaelaps mercedesae]